MLSAVRKGRRELCLRDKPGDRGEAFARLPDLSRHCREFADNAARAAGSLGEHVAATVARAAAPLLVAAGRPPFDPQPVRSQLLLASVSGSTLGEPQKAFLPRRAGPGGGSSGGDGGSGGGGGGDDSGAKDLLADADENERFLISEVREEMCAGCVGRPHKGSARRRAGQACC